MKSKNEVDDFLLLAKNVVGKLLKMLKQFLGAATVVTLTI